MISPRTAFVILCNLAALTTGCKSPPSRFYTLSAGATAATTSSRLAVTVGPVSVPAVVDRPEFVVSEGDNELRLDEFSRWASPLQDNLSRVVAENLAALLGTPRVTLFPPTLVTEVDYRVAIEVQRFESRPGKFALIDAVWTVSRVSDDKSETGRTNQRETVSDDSYDALASAHSRAVATLSQAVADAVRALDASGPKH